MVKNQTKITITADDNTREISKKIEKLEEKYSEIKKQLERLEKNKNILSEKVKTSESVITETSPTQIFIYTKNGIISVDLEPGDRISNIKIKIQDKEKIDPSQQRLIFGGMEYKDENITTEINNPYINLYSKNISNMKSLNPILEQVAKESRSGNDILLIIDEDVLSGVKAINNTIITTNYEILEDLDLWTEGGVITKESDIKFENTSLEILERADKVNIYKDVIIILNANVNQEDNKARVNLIQDRIELFVE